MSGKQIQLFDYQKNLERHLSLWRYLFVMGVLLNGGSWGIISYFIFPIVNSSQQILIILILAGITAGATPTLAPIKIAIIGFLYLTLLPLILQMSSFNNAVYSLFDLTAITYLIYLTIVSFRMHHTIKDNIYLRYENILLLNELKHLATHDPLTNLDNMRLFYDNLSNLLNKARQNKKLIALFYIDIDKFKYINDHYGHRMGDETLKYVATRIKNELRPSDFFARLGGDEFAVILDQNVNNELIIKVAQRICQILEKPVVLNGIVINISGSIGISIYPIDGDNTTTLVQSADDAMYYVKKHGKNNFCLSHRHHLPEKTS